MRKVVFESISIIGIGHFSPQFSDKPSFFVSTELENLDSCSPVNLLDFELGKGFDFHPQNMRIESAAGTLPGNI